MRLNDADELCEICIAFGEKCDGSCYVKYTPSENAVTAVAFEKETSGE